jgi:hypothetical protein
MPALKIMAEYESLESIIVGVEAGCGVAIVYQSTSCVSGKRLALRPLKPNGLQERLSFRFGLRAHFLHQHKMQMEKGYSGEELSFLQRRGD